jgi:hypothetical protein
MRSLPLLAALVCGLAFPLRAQDDSSGNVPDDAIHAITAMNEDGTRTVTLTNPDNHTSEASTYDAAGKLMKKVVYTMDANNQAASGIVYSADNRPVYKAAYKRDGANRISEEDDYTMDDQLIDRFVFEFGPDGRVLRIRGYDAQGNELQQSEARKDRRQSLPRTH